MARTIRRRDKISLKEVIIDDKLGIAEDLEKEMETLVNKFECEWTQAVNDPEMMKRFSHFVNSKEEDDNYGICTYERSKNARTLGVNKLKG